MWRERRGRKERTALQPATPEIERLDAAVRAALSQLVQARNDPQRIGIALAAFAQARAEYDRAFAQLSFDDALKEALRIAQSPEADKSDRVP